MVTYLGLWVLAIVALNMWALISVLLSKAPITSRLVWIAVLLTLPLIGFFAWYLIGPRESAPA